MASTDPQTPRIAPSQRGGSVLVSLYVWTIVTVMVAIARFIVVLMKKVEFGFDDGMALGAVILYTGASVAWNFAVVGGLGKHFDEVSAKDATVFFKSMYAVSIIQVAAMGFAKASSACLVGRVAPQSPRQRNILFGVVGAWSVYSVIAASFQCGVTDLFKTFPQKCSKGGPTYSIIALNMISDVILAGWIFPVLRDLNMDRRRVQTVAILFGSRVFVAVAGVAQMWAVAYANSKDDPTWYSFELAITDHAVTSLSLILANLPRIKRFLGVAGSGLNVIELTEAELTRAKSGAPGSRTQEPLKLIPSNTGRFTTTIGSDRSRKKDKHKNKAQNEWEKFVSMGSKHDEHTSTSSLFDYNGGVMLQQEVTVKVEDSDRYPDER
ncbi:hypothetical protein P154DRAFT_440388 [Amniculicola lignicola CBS 123094]|uniref:Rhodopsin domain-containing protein n=1 Tax=Amniculicola lignicola CBS 123094 TaxID=1392246 RepID=A0A6A5W9I2_9PLEO|nr:hypothetical protein P154DRAFT_440388 [Amniculicola lignicola CBS 123094]